MSRMHTIWKRFSMRRNETFLICKPPTILNKWLVVLIFYGAPFPGSTRRLNPESHSAPDSPRFHPADTRNTLSQAVPDRSQGSCRRMERRFSGFTGRFLAPCAAKQEQRHAQRKQHGEGTLHKKPPHRRFLFNKTARRRKRLQALAFIVSRASPQAQTHRTAAH